MPRYIDADKLIALATHEGAYGYVDVHDIEKAARDGAIDIVWCKDCKRWNDKKRVCECPEWTDMDGWHKATDAEDYCFRAKRKEKTDDPR